MNQGVIGNKRIYLHELIKKFPDFATQYGDIIEPGFEENLPKIFYYYSRFDSFDLPGYRAVHKRRLFIAVMLNLYHPNILKTGIVKIKYGFCKNIGACFNCKQESVTRNIREVVIMYRAYEDFEEKVNEISDNFKGLANQ